MALEIKNCLACGANLGEDLCCDYCGSMHMITDQGPGLGCRRCGAGNLLTASNCNQCGSSLLLDCPECHAKNPKGSRFCSECKIEFRSYRHASLHQAHLAVPQEKVEETVKAWLGKGWFRARDSNKIIIMDSQLYWCPMWVFHTEVHGSVQGQNAQTYYKTETKKKWIPEQEDERFNISITPEGRDGYTHSRPKTGGKWVDEVVSVPYTVWQDVSKEFEEKFYFHERAYDNRDVNQYSIKPSKTMKDLTEIPQSRGSWEHVLTPNYQDRDVFGDFRKKVERSLHSQLLDRVELMKVRFKNPRLKLVYCPIWTIIYRYKRKRKRCWIDGSQGAVYGQSVSILSQLFG